MVQLEEPQAPALKPVEWDEMDANRRLREVRLPKAERQEGELIKLAFLNEDAARMIFEILKPWHFYEPDRQKLFKVMASFFRQGRALEPIGISDALAEDMPDRFAAARLVNDFLGYGAVLPIFHNDPEVWVSWLEAVVLAAAKRFLIKAAQKVNTQTLDGDLALDEILVELKTNLQKIENIGLRKQSTDWLTLLDHPESHTAQVSGALPTGLANLDRLLRGGGLLPGDLVFVGARTSRGKSTLCLQMLTNVADNYSRGQQRPPVAALFALEAKDKAAVRRALGIRAQLSYASLQRGTFEPEEEQRRRAELRKQTGWKIEVLDKRGISFLDIQRECRAIKQKHGHLDIVCIDYLNLIKPENKRGPRQEQLEELTGTAKTFAGDENIPVILPVQIKRQALDSNGNRRKFGLDDFRGSGSIEQDADKCLIIQEPDGQSLAGYQVEVTLAKQREGQVGSFLMFFNKTFGGFEEVPDSVVFGLTGEPKPKPKKKHGPLYQEEEF